MELADFVERFLGIYTDVSAELGAVLGVLFLTLFVVIMLIIFAMFLNSRSNARMRAAQSDTLSTINDLVRAQSDRESKSTDEAKRLNDLLLTQTIEFNKQFSEQSQRLTMLEAKVPIYEEQITDLKVTRDSLMTVIQAERDEWHKREQEMEKRHLDEMSSIKQGVDTHRALSEELQRKLAVVEARLEERERERITQKRNSDQISVLVESVSNLQVIIEDLTKVVANEFRKLQEFRYSAGAVAIDGGGVASGSTGRVVERVAGSGDGHDNE